MAGDGAEQDDKTEAPTQRRLDRARQQGQTAISADLAGCAGLVGAAMALSMLLPGAAAGLGEHLSGWLASPGLAPDAEIRPMLAETLGKSALLVGAVAAMVAVPSVLAHLLQTGFLVSAAQMRPKFSRISPASGLSRLVSAEALVAFLKNLLKLAVLGAIVWHVLAGDIAHLADAALVAPEAILHEARAPFMRVLWAVLTTIVALTVLDVFWTRLRFTRQMRMSRQDLREEHKESEGDPHLKAKLRRIREQRSRQRMMAEVNKSAVVITNPTHFAVALAYDRVKDQAPRVVAKGADAVAARIRAEAKKHDIPVYENPPLARALFTIDLGRVVPPEQYQAVAQVIAYVWGLKSRVAASRGAR
jgi:flagellar biosynthetic protein FlhB